MGFELDRQTRQQLGYKLIDRINGFFDSLPSRNVQLPSDERTFDALSEPMPELGDDPLRVLDDLCGELVDKGFHVPAANYFGLMNPTPTYMAVLAEALVSALNPQLASLARSQLASKIESESVRWIGERVGWTAPFDGTFTSGGNEANFSALALALAKHFPAAIADGVASIGAQPIVYTSAEAHHSLDKSVGLLGLGRKALRRISITERLQLDPQQLQQQIDKDRSTGHRPFCVVATAGTTNSGAIDDLHALADICEQENLWLHLDGAYGASAIFSDKHRGLVSGIERTDSVTIDPHKWLAMPFAAGVVLTRHPQTLRDAFEVSTPYMPKIPGATLIDNFKVSTQWSRRMNSLKFYLTLRVHGRGAYEELIDRQLLLARSAAAWFENSEQFELATPQVLPILNFRLRGVRNDELASAHARLVDEVTRDGKRWISQTYVNGRSVLRMMIISYLTTEEHVRQLQAALVNAAALAKTRSVAAR
jgi:glutamate/tyrosine decarboxylase-like PLP-dependent enzyme